MQPSSFHPHVCIGAFNYREHPHSVRWSPSIAFHGFSAPLCVVQNAPNAVVNSQASSSKTNTLVTAAGTAHSEQRLDYNLDDRGRG